MKTDFIKLANRLEVRQLGSWPLGDGGVQFRLWAPHSERAEVVLMPREGSGYGKSEYIPMERGPNGYFNLMARKIKAGDRYKYRLNGDQELPDPVSRYQPEGPHGPSEVVDIDFKWTDSKWKGLPLEELVIYELHVGTFTDEGTFEGVMNRIPHLKSIGVNAIEIMPVAQFAGKRNWGYDGVGLFATQNSYGGSDIAPVALKALVNRCHEEGIAVILDVVYNHLGPEGNYLSQFGPYFQSKYKTPWGDALNFDGEWSDEVRSFFLENARQWLEEFHFDGLRLDAVHAIMDSSAQPFLEDLGRMKRELQKKLGRDLHLIAEIDTNDSRILHPPEEGGWGMDGHWADDLHHVVHALLSGEKHGYYHDYGTVEQLAQAYRDGVVFHGEYSEFRHRSYGRSYDGISRTRLVVCSQNHDQIGNRMMGDRLMSLIGPEKMKLAAACVFLSPALPLMFMGEELGEDSPFMYFVDHTDKELLEAVRKGRKEEFSSFKWQGEAPDPGSTETFKKSKIKWAKLESSEQGRDFMSYYRRLIELSKWIRREKLLEPGRIETRLLAEGRVLEVKGHSGDRQIQVYLSFSPKSEKVQPDWNTGGLELVLDSSENGGFSNDLKTGLKAGDDTLELKPFSAMVFRRGN